VVEASYTCNLHISFGHTTGSYSDAEHPLKPLENIYIYVIAEKSPPKKKLKVK
jgi:hypothetical protein